MKLCKFALPAICAIAIVCASTHSFATVLSSWTYDTNPPADLSNSTTGPVVASDGGIFPGNTTGTHASAATDWSTPAGNGTTDSYSVNTWAVGDYFQLSSSSTGYENLSLTFYTTGSGTGPKDFKIQASTDGLSFSDIGFTYAVLLNGVSPTSTWSVASGVQAAYAVSTPLPASLNNSAAIYLRLVNSTTTSINNGTTAAAGTNRIDTVVIEGTEIPPVVPEPTSIALMFGCIGLMAFRRK